MDNQSTTQAPEQATVTDDDENQYPDDASFCPTVDDGYESYDYWEEECIREYERWEEECRRDFQSKVNLFEMLSANPIHSNESKVLLPFQQHKSQWTLNEQQKWANRWVSSHKKDPKPKITKRPDNYTRSRKRNLRKKSRIQTTKEYVEDFHRYYDPWDLPKYSRRRHRNSGWVEYRRKKKVDPRFARMIICNQNYKFTHSLSELTSLPSDFLLNRTVHLLFTKHDIPFVGRLTCISHCGFINIEDLKIKRLTEKHKLRGFYSGDLMESRGKVANSKWFHYKCIGRVMVYEEGTRRYRDITSMMMDLMKYKMVQWLTMDGYYENGEWDIIQHCATSCEQDDVGAIYCDCDMEKERKWILSDITKAFDEETNRCNFHAMILRLHHKLQLNQMRFEQSELGEILRHYARIGGKLSGKNKEKKERERKENKRKEKEVKKEKCGFMAWDSKVVSTMSKKMRKETRTC